MQATRFLLLILSVMAGCASSFGRIGENAQDLQKRYGAPVSCDAVGAFHRCAYQKDGFGITVYFTNGASVMEIFAERGFDQATARKLAVKVASTPQFAAADADHEAAIRAASGITNPDEMFWTWPASGDAMTAAYNPVECTLTFFNNPAVYADVQRALASQPL
jgi:hypothetical protein